MGRQAFFAMAFSLLLFALQFLHSVSAVSPRAPPIKRDAPFIPARIDIPLLYDEFGRYVTRVNMSTGTSRQDFNFTMTTGTGLTYVAGASCKTCGKVNLYNQTLSSTASPVSNANSTAFFDNSTNASIVKEFCALTAANGSAWNYPNQTIVVVNQPVSDPSKQLTGALLGTSVSGIVGLGTNRQPKLSSSKTNGSTSGRYTAGFADSIYGQWLLQHPQALNFTFGLALNPPIANLMSSGQVAPDQNSTQATAMVSKSNAGTLHWLQPDPSFYDASKASWVDVGDVVGGGGPTQAQDWVIHLDGWLFSSGNNHLSNSEGFMASVDPAYVNVYLPLDQARLIHDAIPGSSPVTSLSSLGTLSQAWQVPCNATFSFGLAIGSQRYSVGQSSLLTVQNGACYSGIESWTDANETQYLIGASFLSQIYVMFNVSHDGGHSIGFAPRANVTTKSVNVGAIVGGTIGGAAFLLLVIFAVVYCIRDIRARKQLITPAQWDLAAETAKLPPPQSNDVAPRTPWTATATQSLSSPLLADHSAPPAYEPSSPGFASEHSRPLSSETSSSSVAPTPVDIGFVPAALKRGPPQW